MVITVASFGCGVDSVAGLLLTKDSIPYNEIVFADTGSEPKQVYDYLEYFSQFFPITIVRSHLGKLHEFYFDKKMVPIISSRMCTDKFKIRVIRKYLREKYGRKETFAVHIFYDKDEWDRQKTSDVKYATNIYPIVDHYTRAQLRKIITILGFKVPMKSGCFCCPFNNIKRWNFLYKNNREEYDISMKLLENSTLKDKKLYLKSGSGRCGCY